MLLLPHLINCWSVPLSLFTKRYSTICAVPDYLLSVTFLTRCNQFEKKIQAAGSNNRFTFSLSTDGGHQNVTRTLMVYIYTYKGLILSPKAHIFNSSALTKYSKKKPLTHNKKRVYVHALWEK